MSCSELCSPLRVPAKPSSGERKEKFFQMDFFGGIKRYLFSYVLLSGIFITIQTKEGEWLFFLSKSFKNLVALNLSEILLKESTRAMRDTNLKVVVLTTRKYSSSFMTVLHCSVSFFISMFYLDKKKNFAEFGLIINHQQCWDFVCAAVNHVASAGEICHNLSDFFSPPPTPLY